ncbi:MAG TPA: DUF433 domain-containing protein [Polyangiaceae bacterium]|jgi:uncharacterized protein (DUF433 family)|nr:DUF433 domain-containing protein [Polyangiaceae bacterium]
MTRRLWQGGQPVDNQVTGPTFLSAEHVCRLAQIPLSRLRYWERTKAFVPQHQREDEPHPELYSFRDAVGLRVLAILRGKGVPLQELRKVDRWLSHKHKTPWSSLRFYVAGKRVYFKDPESDAIVAGRPIGQGVMLEIIDLEPIMHDLARAANNLKTRGRDDIGRIERRRGVMGGATVIKGTRVLTRAIKNFHDEGYDTAAIVRQYPQLTAKDIAAALEYERRQGAKKAG